MFPLCVNNGGEFQVIVSVVASTGVARMSVGYELGTRIDNVS